MPKHKLLIVQVLRVERHIVVDVEADTLDAAIECQENDDAPPYEDPGWVGRVDLENETVEACPTTAL